MGDAGDRFNFENVAVPSAASTTYTPAVPGNWSPVPTTVAGALDQEAARIVALEAASPVVPEIAGSALAIGVSLYRSSANKMLAEDGTYATVKDAFAGFSVTAALADGDAITVAGNGARATGLTSISKGVGYYVSAGVLIKEADIAAFVAGAASGTCYRFVGTGDSTTSIKQAWGEPQQVP